MSQYLSYRYGTDKTRINLWVHGYATRQNQDIPMKPSNAIEDNYKRS